MRRVTEKSRRRGRMGQKNTQKLPLHLLFSPGKAYLPLLRMQWRMQGYYWLFQYATKFYHPGRFEGRMWVVFSRQNLIRMWCLGYRTYLSLLYRRWHNCPRLRWLAATWPRLLSLWCLLSAGQMDHPELERNVWEDSSCWRIVSEDTCLHGSQSRACGTG